MDRFIPPEKRSKKEQKKLNAKRRRTWGEMSPVTRTVPNGKAYDRKKQKNEDRRSSRNFREEGPAAFMSAGDPISASGPLPFPPRGRFPS